MITMGDFVSRYIDTNDLSTMKSYFGEECQEGDLAVLYKLFLPDKEDVIKVLNGDTDYEEEIIRFEYSNGEMKKK